MLVAVINCSSIFEVNVVHLEKNTSTHVQCLMIAVIVLL